jgi:hypothetical protein
VKEKNFGFLGSAGIELMIILHEDEGLVNSINNSLGQIKKNLTKTSSELH